MPRKPDARQWKVVLEPAAKDLTDPDSQIVVCYMSEHADLDDAITDAEGYAELIDRDGGVGRWALGVADFVPGSLVRRQGKRSWRVRLDCWEHETDTGYDEGYGWLRVAELYVIEPAEISA